MTSIHMYKYMFNVPLSHSLSPSIKNTIEAREKKCSRLYRSLQPSSLSMHYTTLVRDCLDGCLYIDDMQNFLLILGANIIH